MEDCYYFLYSSCRMGDKCAYRHSEACRTNLVTCRNWKAKRECAPSCSFRHSEYHLKKKREDEMCYWETKPSGCTKERCEYKHADPEKDSWKERRSRQTDTQPVEDYEEVLDLKSPENSPKETSETSLHDEEQEGSEVQECPAPDTAPSDGETPCELVPETPQKKEHPAKSREEGAKRIKTFTADRVDANNNLDDLDREIEELDKILAK